MHIDLYPANNEVSDPVEDFLDLLHQQGFTPTRSLVEGSVICHLSGRPLEAFFEAIRQWNAQASARHAQPDELVFRDFPAKDPTFTITVHPAAVKAGANSSRHIACWLPFAQSLETRRQASDQTFRDAKARVRQASGLFTIRKPASRGQPISDSLAAY